MTKKKQRLPTSFPLFLCGLLFSSLLSSPSTTIGATAYQYDSPIAIYATQMAQPNTNTTFIEATHKALREVFYPRRVTFAMLPIAELDAIVSRKQASIVMAGAGFYRRHLRDGLRDIATVVSPLQPNPDRAVGSTIVTLKTRDDINTLEDLKGKVVSANAPVGFQGLLIVKNELAKAGFDPDAFFKKEVFVGMDLLPSIKLLEDGVIDAAILTSCLIEESVQRGMTWPQELKIINEKTQDDVACRVSSELYPNWSIYLTPTVDAETTRKIVYTIHAMPKSSDGIEWAIATDFSPVDEMYRRLKLGPYQHLREWTVKRLFNEYGPWIAVVLLCIVGLIGQTLLLSYLVRKRTALLSDSLKKLQAQNRTISMLTERYEAVTRAATVSQISCIIAHELSQPLAGIILYAEGLKNILTSSQPAHQANQKTLLAGIEKISARARKADDIVQSVRNRAKNKKPIKSTVDLGALIVGLKHDFSLTEAGARVEVNISVPAAPFPIIANDFEIKLALLNLLRNSAQATQSTEHPKIDVKLTATDKGNFLITVSDNGPAISDDLLQRLNDPVVSVKDDGLGLGLSIVRSIVESHFGHLNFAKTDTGALLVQILIPCSPPAASDTP